MKIFPASRFFILIFPLFLGSCFINRQSSGEPFSAKLLRAFQPGKTEAKDVVAKLGAPSNIVRLNEGSAYVYEHTQGKTAGVFLLAVFVANTDQRADRVWFFFDKNDRLTHMGATLAASRSEYSMPWEDLYDDLPSRMEKGAQGESEK